jgi:hypothetical protein
LKCGSGLSFVEHAAVPGGLHRRTVDIIQQTLHQVGCRRQVFQPLLVLNADDVAAEIVGDAQRRDVHLALIEDLGVGEIGFGMRSGMEVHALFVQPVAHRARLFVGHFAHGGIQRRLAQALFENSQGHQVLVGNDGVVHAHAPLVEHAHDGLLAAQLAGQFLADGHRLGRQTEGFQVAARGTDRAAPGLPDSHCRRPVRKCSSEKFSLHSVE